jgi:hypothetical protein
MTPIRSLLIFLIAAPYAAPLVAQTALVSDATVRATSAGGVVAMLKQGTTVTVGAVRGAEVYVTFGGWLDGAKLGAAKDSFSTRLTGDIAMRLRSAPSMKGVILGEVRPGTGLFKGEKQVSWVKVHRGGWVESKTLPREALANATAAASAAKAETKSAAKTSPATAKPAPTVAKAVIPPAKNAAKSAPAPVAKVTETEPASVIDEAMPNGALRVARAAVIRNAPNGLVIGQIGAGTIVEPLARSRGWVRVRTSVWIPERDVVPTDSSFGATYSAADLRADPEGTRGKTVRWEVQVLALQFADQLRRDLAKDEPYFLAKGPGSEDALLYLAVPPSLLAEAHATPPLTRILVTARVRTGRSQPVGIPILDILSFTKQ